MRRLNAFITQLRTTALGPLTVVRSRDLPSTPDESEPIVNAFNQLERHLDGLRDAGQRLALVSAALRTSAREMAVSVERMETPARSQPAVTEDASPTTAVPSIPMEERRAHLRLLKTVA
jgi:methyl-accepting chemotaxis protein